MSNPEPYSNFKYDKGNEEREYGQKQLLTDFFLKTCKEEVGEEEKRFLFLDDLEEIRVFPLLLLGERIVPGLAELYTDRVGFHLSNHKVDQVSALLGDVSGAHERNFFPFEGEGMHIGMIKDGQFTFPLFHR